METHWSFAIVNNRLAEIFFRYNKAKRIKKFFAHCYVNKSEYTAKKEQKMIQKDIKDNRYRYYKGKYIHTQLG